MDTQKKYFIYLRKSTDSEDRQITSIADQKKELDIMIKRLGLKVVGIYQENISAKKPGGRPMFNKMLTEIKAGKAEGIISWKLNRLSRNPIDGGEIMWLMQEGVLKSIQTPGREYKTGDNVLIMAVELGLANQFLLDLSTDVKRGMLSKVNSGWRPGRAPIGYKNDKTADKGKKKIHVDAEKFPIVRKMWDLMLTGDYSVSKIIDIANNEWGLRRHTRKGEIKMHESHGYDIFTNKFYCGEFDWMGEAHVGHHKKMITRAEFDYVQKLLGIKTKSQTRHKDLPYRGTIICGGCGCHITTEVKIKRIKSKNIVKTFIYHHCTRKKLDAHCKEKAISHIELNKQILKALDKINLPENFLDFTLNTLRRDNELEIDNRDIMIRNQQNALKVCQARIDNLLKIFISVGNENKELLSDEEFKEQKAVFLAEKTEIEEELEKLSLRANEWLELTEETFKFATYAKENFATGDYQTKTRILRALGSDFVLKNGEVNITLRKQYKIIEKGLEKIKAENPGLELTDFALNKTKTAQSKAVSAILSG